MSIIIQSFTLPDIQVASYLIVFVLGIIVGMTIPTYYGIERLSGFGRAVADRLPYKPPPGMEEDEAMEEATDKSKE